MTASGRAGSIVASVCFPTTLEASSMKILVLPGDGIGPEISQATLAVLDRASAIYKLGLEWQRDEIGFTTLKKEGTTLPPRILDQARAAAGVILGPVSHL